MKKVKRFQEGGYEDSDDFKNLMKAQAREDANAAEPGTETTAAFMKRTGTKANPPMSRTFTSKGPTVTKEQVKKAGFDNLRDYLNAEQGLKRRDGKAAPAEASAAASTPAPARSRMTGGKSGDADRDIGSSVRSSSYGEAARSARTLGDVMKEDLERSAAIRSGKEKTLGTRFQEGMRKFGRALATGQPQGGMKKGGVVSSASKRADGIAVKGKTKGRMV